MNFLPSVALSFFHVLPSCMLYFFAFHEPTAVTGALGNAGKAARCFVTQQCMVYSRRDNWPHSEDERFVYQSYQALKLTFSLPFFLNNHILHSLTLFTSLLISSLAFWWFHFQPSYQKVWTSSRPSPHSCPRSVFHQPSTKLPASKSSLKPVTAVFLPLLWFRSFIAWECRKLCPHSPEAKVKFFKKKHFIFIYF